jgi:DNA-binding transcriptional regulator LsrR (DeoR family)
VFAEWSMARADELRLMTRVAQMYYAEGHKQAEISARLHISQATISRLLKKALAENIIKITINAPRGTFPDLENRLRERYGIVEAIVAECGDDSEDSALSGIGEAAAHFIETTLDDGEVIGISSWSASLLGMVDRIHPLKHVSAERVVQTLGGIGNPGVQVHATHLTMRLAQLTGAQPQLLPAQGVANSAAAKLVMLGDSYVRGTMDQFRRVTLALVGIGATEPSKMLANSGNVFTPEELSELRESGAVGDICLRFFDQSGAIVRTPLDDRVIGMTLDEIHVVSRVVGIAGGQRKVEAIRAAMLGRHINILITDKFTAAKLIA